MKSDQQYIYHGDLLAKQISPYAGQICTAMRRPDGKCLRGKNGNMLMNFSGSLVIIPARHLRKIKPCT